MSKLIGRKVKYVEDHIIDNLYGKGDTVIIIGIRKDDPSYVVVSIGNGTSQIAMVNCLRYLNNRKVVV